MALLKDSIVNGASRFIGEAYFNLIKAGTWQGTAINGQYGGLGKDARSTGGTTTPIYIDANGVVQTCTAYSNASVASASHADYPTGFTSKATGGWGTLTSSNGYTILTDWHYSDGSDVVWAAKSGEAYLQIDGFFYQNGGQYKVLDSSHVSGAGGSTAGSSITVNGITLTIPSSLPANGGTAAQVTNSLSWTNAAGTAQSYNGSAAKSITSLALTENVRALDFRPIHASYHTWVEYMTVGNEALVFGAMQAVTSFIFKCGVTLTDTSDWAAAVPSPTMQLKNQSLYINQLIANGVSPTYNFLVNGNAKINTTLNVDGLTSLSTLDVSGAASFSTTISGNINGNAGTATLLQNSRNITIGSKTLSFNGGSNLSFSLTEIGAAASSHGIHPSSSTAGYVAYYSAASTIAGTSLLTIDTANSKIVSTGYFEGTNIWGITSNDYTVSLSNAAWTEVANLPTTSGSYMIQITCNSIIATGVFSVGSNDAAKDEISLHVHGAQATWRIYARTEGGKLKLSSSDASASSKAVTIKTKRII